MFSTKGTVHKHSSAAYHDNIASLQKEIQYKFKDEEILDIALTHRSSATFFSGGRGNNERLEFLGDAVLDKYVATVLFHKFPEHDEGQLTKMRSTIVSQKTLAKVAKSLRLDRYLHTTGLPGSSLSHRVLANTLEALIGAISTDGGDEEADKFMARIFQEEFLGLSDQSDDRFNNPVGYLQEQLARQHGTAQQALPPVYKVMKITGPPHSHEFEVCVIFDGKRLGCGKGPSLKMARQNAARASLRKHFRL